MSEKSLKISITEAVKKQLPDEDSPIETLVNEWWFTRSGSSLRLSQIGDMMFRKAEIEFFDLPLKVNPGSWYSFISACGWKLKCPFYIGTHTPEGKPRRPRSESYIRLYDSKIAMMMTLYGDIHSYLESIKVRR